MKEYSRIEIEGVVFLFFSCFFLRMTKFFFSSLEFLIILVIGNIQAVLHEGHVAAFNFIYFVQDASLFLIVLGKQKFAIRLSDQMTNSVEVV